MSAEKIIQQVKAAAHVRMRDLGISYDTGFLAPYDTDHYLPHDSVNRERGAYFENLEQTVRTLPDLIEREGVIQAVTALEVPVWSFSDLRPRSQHVLMLEVTMLAHAALREMYRYDTVAELYQDQTEKYLWPQLAVPSWQLHELTGIDPTMAYWLYGISNKRLVDPRRDLRLGNVEPFFTFTGTTSENWFVAIHLAIEAILARAIDARFRAYYTSLHRDDAPLEYLAQCLKEASEYARQAVEILKRMREHLDVRTYFSDVRMNYAFPQNVVFMGVNKLRRVGQYYNGETGGGSAAAHQLGDAVRGTEFRPENKEYIQTRRMQMPTPIRDMLYEIEGTSLVRELVLAHPQNDQLVEADHLDAQTAVDFGLVHEELVVESIAEFGDTRGTANPALTFLRDMNEDRDRRAHIIYPN